MADATGGGASPPLRASRLAVASLVLGIAGIATCVLGLVLGLPAVVIGVMALAKLGRRKGRLRGSGMAIAGIVTGGVSVLWFLLLVIAAAVVVPASVRSQRLAKEAEVASSLWNYAMAQNTYRRDDHDGDGVYEYACPYVRLFAGEGEGEPILLIDGAFADASRDHPPSGTTVPRCGYVYVDIVGNEGGETYDDGNGNFVDGFGLCAVPVEYGTTGRNTYIIGLDCTVYYKDTEGKPVTEYPPLDEEGWATFGY